MFNKAAVSIISRYAESATNRADWPESYRRWLLVCDVARKTNKTPSKRAVSHLKNSSLKYARMLYKENNQDGAEKVLIGALEYVPLNLSFLIQLADIAVKSKDLMQAISQWQRVIEFSREIDVSLPDKTTVRIRKIFLNYSKELVENGDYGTAQTVLDIILSVAPQDTGVLIRYAEVAMLLQEWLKAIERWEKVIEAAEQKNEPVPEKVYVELKKAKQEYALEQKPVRLKYVEECLARGDYNIADDTLEELLPELPGDKDVLYQYARVAMSSENWEQAIDRWKTVLNEQSENLENVLVPLSKVYYNKGMIDKAIKVLTGVIECELEGEKLFVQLAKLHVQKGNWEQASELINRIGNEYPDNLLNVTFATLAARVFWRLNDIDKASLIIERAVENKNIDDLPLKTKFIINEIRRRKNNDSEKTSLEVSSNYYDDIYKESKKYKVDAKDSVYMPLWKQVVDIIRRENITSVLDLGCGPGQFAEYLTDKLEITYTGLDYSKVAVEQAHKKGLPAVFMEADILKSDVMTELEYDAVIMLEVLEHIEDDKVLLDRIPKGKPVIASVPNYDSFGHVRFFNNKDCVKERYDEFFSELYIDTITVNNNSVIYLLYGHKE